MEFISAAFNGEVLSRKERPDGSIMHAEMRIRDSMLMMGEATDEFGPMPTSIYLSVCERLRQCLRKRASCRWNLSFSADEFAFRGAIRRS